MNHSDSSPNLQNHNHHPNSIPNLQHKAFELVTFVDKLPLQIECIACYENILILGLTSGRILIYEAKIDPSPPIKLEGSFERTIAVTKKPIQQIEVSKEFGVLVALFDAQIHVFDLKQYSLEYSLPKTKSCTLFALSSSKDNRILRMCVGSKKRLQFYYATRKSKDETSTKFMELCSDLELNDTPRTLEFTRENLVVYSLRKEFFYYQLPSNSANLSRPPESKFSNGSRVMEPLCQKLYDDSFVVGIDENKTIMYDAFGGPSLSYPIMWSSSPSVVTAVGFYLVGIVPSLNCVEVVTYEPEMISVQLVETGKELSIPSINTSSASLGGSHSGSLITSKIMDNVSSLTHGLTTLATTGGTGSSNSGSDKLKFLKSNGNSICYVANTNNVWCLVPIKLNDQLEQVLLHKHYYMGLSLMACQKNFNASMTKFKDDATAVESMANLLKPFFSLKWLVTEIDENLMRKIENLNALDLFRHKRFKESYQIFQSMKTDPTHLIAFLPGLLPESFRAKLEFDSLYVEFNAKEQEEAIDALIDYLNTKRRDFIKLTDNQPLNLIPLLDGRSVCKDKLQILQIIDTTLLKCYLKSKENLVHVFLRIHPNFLHLKESERLLLQHNKLSELITLYERKDAHEKALNLLMTESSKSNSTLSGLKHLVDYLKKLGNKNIELIFQYSKCVLEKDLQLGMRVFFSGEPSRIDEVLLHRANEMNESLTRPRRSSQLQQQQQQSTTGPNKKKSQSAMNELDMSDFDDDPLKELNHEQVVGFFEQSIEPKELSSYLIRTYLQYCVYIWADKSANLSNLLIDVYKRYVESLYANLPSGTTKNPAFDQSVTYRKLLKLFLSETSSYDMSYALSKLDLDDYPEERAIVLGRMGKHHEALNIYVNKLNEPEKAEAYCNYIYSQQQANPGLQQQQQQNVYYELLQIYLQSDYEEVRIDGSVSLLNAHSNKIGTSQTLELLPAQLMKCKNLSQFFETMLYRLTRTKHDTQIRKKLMIALQLQVHETKIISHDKKFVVTDEKMCEECKKRLGKSAFVRFPDGVLIHYGCLKNYDTTGATTSSSSSSIK